MCYALVAIVIASAVPALPVDAASRQLTVDTAQHLQRLCETALSEGKKEIRLTPGTWRLTGKGDRTHLELREVHDLVIDGTGVTWLCTDPSLSALRVSHSSNLTIRGLTIDHDPLTFTQGAIYEIDPGGRWVKIAIDAGYPTDLARFQENIRCTLHNGKVRRLKRGALDWWATKSITGIEPGKWRLEWPWVRDPEGQNMEAGDRVVIARGGQGTISYYRCTSITTEDLTIHAGGGIAIQEDSGAGSNTYRRVRVVPGPRPAGATIERYGCVTADGIHSSGMKVGPLIESCEFAAQGDDAIAIHGKYALVVTEGRGKVVVISPPYGHPFDEGDRFHSLDPTTYSLEAEARVIKVEEVERPDLVNSPPVVAARERLNDYKGRKPRHIELTLDREIDFAVGDYVTSIDRIGTGYIIRNNTIRSHRARGLNLKAGDGLIEGNTIERSAQCAIVLGAEFDGWLESAFPHKVVVRNNTIRNVGLSSSVAHAENHQLIGAITLCARTGRGIAPCQRIRDIVIENNIIESCGTAAICITSARNVKVTGNRIRRTHQMDCARAGTKRGLDPTAAIIIEQASAVTLSSNSVRDMGKAGKQPVWVGPRTENVVGAGSGVSED